MKSKKWIKLFTILALAAILFSACGGLPRGETLVWIDVPLDGLFAAGIQTIDIDGHATSPGGVSRVELWANGTLLTTIEAPPADGDLASFHFEWTPSDYGDYTIQAISFGASGTASEPDSARVSFDRLLEDVLPLCAADALVAPLLVSPADGATVEPNPVFAWSYPNAACHPYSYMVDISEDASFADSSWGFGTLDHLETTRSWPLPSGQCYYWRVRAYIPDESGPASGVWSFCVAEAEVTVTETPTPTPPPALEPIVQFWAEPAKIQAGACTTIKWHVENVQSVIFGGIQQGFDGSNKDCLCKSERYSLTVTYLDGTQEKRTVDISVSGVCETPIPENNNPPADTTPPPAPELVVPGNGLTLACVGSQSMVWLPVSDPSGIARYEVQIKRHAGDGNWQTVSGSPFSVGDKTMSLPVECGWTYRWRVRAVDGAGNLGSWSSWFQYTITLS